MDRYNQQAILPSANTAGGGRGNGSSQASLDTGQLAREQAQRLYNQQLQRQPQQQPQQQHYHNFQRPSLPQGLSGMSGCDDSLDAFAWDGPSAHQPMQQFSAAQFSRNPSSHLNRQHQQQQPMLARQGFSSELSHKDVGSGDLASALSLPTSSGTEGRVGLGMGPKGPNKRKGGRCKKAPPNESQSMQRCLDVLEQLLEEEDAEPFAEPVDAKALGLHNYHQIIRRPMDLGTIKDNLMAEPPSYFSSADVLKDVQQVWANCRTYNDEDEPIVDMCDNMERFFYQAWKEGGLPVPPGAGPTLSRVRSTGAKGQSSAWHADQQTNRGHKRKFAGLPFEGDSDDGGYDETGAPASHSAFPLTKGGSLPHQKHPKGVQMNPTSTGTASSHRENPLGNKKQSGVAAAPEPMEPPVQVQLSAQELEAEKADREAVAAWESLQKQRQKAQQVIQAAQDAVRKLNEAQTALGDVHKTAAAQEAAQAAAEALHPWPADPCLVSPNYPAYPSAPPQLLNPNVANLGSYLFSLPGGINAEGHDASQDALINNNGAEEHPGSAASLLNQVMSKGRETTDSATRHSKGWQDSHLNMQSQDHQQHVEQPTGWQQWLKSGMSQQQLQQQLQQIAAGQTPGRSFLPGLADIHNRSQL
ncbi:hypothetical protein WJX77_009116 [Trebouxia sp. C0004]